LYHFAVRESRGIADIPSSLAPFGCEHRREKDSGDV